MSVIWPTLDAAGWDVAGIEQQGLHEHEWLRTPSESRTWLFKPARLERHRAIGEDTAEKAASELAQLIGIPAARVELATRDASPGVLVEDARPPGWELAHGRVLMTEAVDDYDPGDSERSGHSPETIQAALGRFSFPPTCDVPQNFAAFDVFAGYLIFDALIAHVDRHDRNWAVLAPPPDDSSPPALCASFDHAASLGFTLSPAQCEQHLKARSTDRWARQGRASRFEHTRGTQWQSLVDVAGRAARLCHADVRRYWRERILSVDRDSFEQVIGAAPAVAEVTCEFIVELLLANQRRLINELD